MSDRIFNFAAGPAILPEPVLQQTQKDIWNIAGSGIGIMEHSHRGKIFEGILAQAVADIRELAGVPDGYQVLFLQGGASSQFFMIPMNLLKHGQTADYIVTGVWAQKAVDEARPFGTVHLAASSEEANFNFVPEAAALRWSPSPAYAHYTSNNTIFGTQFKYVPAPPANTPLICDASSDIFSKPIDVKKHALIYAGAQKNLGPSGLTLVIIRDDLVQAGAKALPTMLQYRTHVKNTSMYNTPPTLGVYVLGQVLKWLKGQGGLAAMGELNQAKAKVLYDHLDQSSFFKATARAGSRSDMNVCFRGPNEDLEDRFIKEATKRGLDGLKGHRSVGGMRASIYNAFPRAGVEALVAFMKEFERANR